MSRLSKKNSISFEAHMAAFLFVLVVSVVFLARAVSEAATWHEFPDFETEGELIGGEYVYTMETLDGVPSYLNSKSNGSYGSGASYYQCTEYVARYLHARFGTDYTDQKDLNNDDTQGFFGYDFHPDYDGNPRQPTVERGTHFVRLRQVTAPKVGDIVIDTNPRHSAIVQSVAETTVELVEQNWIWNNMYTTDRTISTSDPDIFFYRFDPVGYYADGWHADGSSQAIFDAYVANGYTDLGGPCDHGGGERVHEYTFWSSGNNIAVHLQDFAQDEGCTDGQTTICYLPGADEACLLKGCIGCLWWEYQCLLGAPTSNETDDTSQFPAQEQADGFDIMQSFQYGDVFWDRETEVVRIISQRGTCEEGNITACLPCSVEMSSLDLFGALQLNSQQSHEWPTCAELKLSSGLDDGPWPMFGHDPRHTCRGNSEEAAHGLVKWNYQFSGPNWVDAAPVIGSDRTIYVGWRNGYIYAINMDGTLKWAYNTGSDIYSSPAIAFDGTIYVGSSDNYLYALNPDGSLKWQALIGSRISCPSIGDAGTIYVGSNDNYLYALNPDGSLKWQYETEGTVSDPAIGLDGTIYVGSSDNYLYALNPDGSLKWQTLIGSRVTPPSIGDDGTIYVGSNEDNNEVLYALDPEGNSKWQYRCEYNVSLPAIGSDGTIYIMDAGVKAISPDGGLRWHYGISTSGGSILSIDANDTVIVALGNQITAITADGHLKWLHIPDTHNARHFTSAAIGPDGTLYVARHGGHVYAFGIPDGKGLLYGRVTDLATGMAIPAASISTATAVESGDSGNYLIMLNPGVYDVTCTKTGYETINISDILVREGKATQLDIELTLPGPLNVVTEELPAPEKTVSYTERVRITGGTRPYTYSIAYGDLPPGLVLDPEFGYISGTPTTNGSYTFAIGVTDSLGGYAEREFTLQVAQALAIPTDSGLPRGTISSSYLVDIVGTGGTAPYTFSVVSGELPLDLTMSSRGHIGNKITSTIDFDSGVLHSSWGFGSARVLNGKLKFGGNLAISARIQTRVKDGVVSFDYDVRLDGAYFDSSFSFLIDGQRQARWRGHENGHYEKTISEGVHNFEWELIQTIDAYLSHPNNYAVIDNVHLPVDLIGDHSFTVQVTDNLGRKAEKAFRLEVCRPLVTTTSMLNDGIVGAAYNQTIGGSGGYGTYVWAVYSGILPSGLSLDSLSGVLSGTPTEATYGTIVLSVSDEDGRITYKDFTLQVSDPLQILTTTLPNGLRDVLFSEAIRLSGGIEPFTFSYTGQLPAGLSLNSSTGIISGTPTTAGYTNVSITVSDSTWPANQAVTQNLGIRITSLLTITTSAVLPKGKMDVAINPMVLGAGGGLSPYTWAVTGGYMPEGIALNRQTGELSGTPLDKGDFVFTVQVTDANSNTAEKEFFWHISGDLTIVTGAIPDGAIGVSYSFTLEAKGGLLPYQWRIKSGTLPSGLFFNGTTGTIYGKPTTRQTYPFTVEVSDNDSPAQTAEKKDLIIEILDDLYVYTNTLPNGRIDEAYTATIRAQLGKPPYQWRLESGVLPPGLTLTSSPTVATLEGTPTEVGTYVFTVEVSDTGTPVKRATKEYTVDIYGDVVIETTGLESAVRGVPYSDSIIVSGGELPYTWKIVEGSLPAGLTLNSTSGHISGITNLVTGHSSTFTVRVTDSGNPYGFDEKDFVIYVIDPLAIVTETIQGALQKAYYQAPLQGEGGISPYHWSIANGSLPEGLELDSNTGVISGHSVECGTFNFTVRLEDSAPAPNIHTRSYNLDVLCCDDYEISGRISTLEGVLVTLTGDASRTTTTDAEGNYKFEHLSNGTYTITPSQDGVLFEPVSRVVTVNNRDVAGVNFAEKPVEMADINGDGDVDLNDAILALQLWAGITPTSPVRKDADVNNDGKIGLEEVIYILHKLAGLR